MRTLSPLIFVLSLIVLTGCETASSFMDNIGLSDIGTSNFGDRQSEKFLLESLCPAIEIVEELAAFSAFSPPQASQEEQLQARAHISEIESACEFGDRSVTVEIELDFITALGPQGRRLQTYSFPYFVAVTTKSGKILTKEVFQASVNYPTTTGQTTHKEGLRQIIPLDNPSEAQDLKILVGFQLKQEQLDYNRKVIAMQNQYEKFLEEQQKLIEKLQIQQTSP